MVMTNNKGNTMKPQILNGKFYSYIVRYKDGNDIKLKHYFAENLKELFDTIETWKRVFCIYQDSIIDIKQVMEEA